MKELSDNLKAFLEEAGITEFVCILVKEPHVISMGNPPAEHIPVFLKVFLELIASVSADADRSQSEGQETTQTH
jgi:hypothetical protein